MLNKILCIGYRYFLLIGRKLNQKSQHRVWSNNMLAQFGHIFNGSVCNVSGWKDEARDGSHRRYKDFFPNAENYTVTNYPGRRGHNAPGSISGIALDLEESLPKAMENSFDVVFNHTTLEHVFDVNQAARTLCRLTKDILIVVVPFMQEQHFEDGSYGDYWRFTPTALSKIFERHGIETLFISANDTQPWYPIYIFYIGSKNPEKWKSSFDIDIKKALERKVAAQLGNWVK